jgi:hypothetical protein
LFCFVLFCLFSQTQRLNIFFVLMQNIFAGSRKKERNSNRVCIKAFIFQLISRLIVFISCPATA